MALVGLVAFVHTAYGREIIRSKVEDQVSKLFTGGATIGRVEGSPFGTLALRDIVIDGPDHQPAISVGSLAVSVQLRALLGHDVRVTSIEASDVAIDVKRDADGRFELAQLMAPSNAEPDAAGSAGSAAPAKSSSGWTIELPAIAVHRGRVRVDTGTPDAGVVDLDDLAIDASARLGGNGSKSGRAQISATWRERSAPIAIAASFGDDGERVSVPTLSVHVGGVAIDASALELVRHDGRAPGIAGLIQIAASRAAVAALDPRVQLPDDLALAVRAQRAADAGGPTPITLWGTYGTAPVFASLAADLDAQRLVGRIATGTVDLARVTRGQAGIDGTGAVAIELAAHARHRRCRHARRRDRDRGDANADGDREGQAGRRRQEGRGRRAASVAGHRRMRRPPRRRWAARSSVALTAHGTLQPSLDVAVAGSDHRQARARRGSLDRRACACSSSRWTRRSWTRTVPRQPRGTARHDARARRRARDHAARRDRGRRARSPRRQDRRDDRFASEAERRGCSICRRSSRRPATTARSRSRCSVIACAPATAPIGPARPAA